MRLDPRQVEVVDDRVAEVLKTKTPAERLRIGFNIWISARRMLLAHIGDTHPEWSQQEVNDEVVGRLLNGPS